MLRQTVFLASALGLAATPVALGAQAPNADVKCMMISNVFATKETDPKLKQAAILSVAFYLGRIDAKLTPAQFKASALLIGKQPLGKDLALVMTNCARGMQAKQVATAQMMQQLEQEQAKK